VVAYEFTILSHRFELLTEEGPRSKGSAIVKIVFGWACALRLSTLVVTTSLSKGLQRKPVGQRD